MGPAMSKADWIWMAHPAHYICSFDCRFHLATKVGGVIVSTVGEYFPDAPIREIMAKSRGIKLRGIGDERKHDYLERIGFDEVGIGRLYETMVFKAIRNAVGCCPWVADTAAGALETAGYADADSAYHGHLNICDIFEVKRKLARKQEIALDSNAKRKANGTKAGRKPSVWPEVAFKIKVARFNDGRTIRWIAKEFGISTTTVQRIIKGGPA